MNSTEQKNEMNRRKDSLEQRLSQIFKETQVRGKRYFLRSDGSIFTLSKFPGAYALVIEYAESYEEALLYRLEDGDRFYLDDMDEETMFQSMLREIG